jgi:hypothetical protein
MSKKNAESRTRTVGGALYADEIEALDRVVEQLRRATGAPVTRSSLMRDLVVARIQAENVNP